jgi:riboflavin kinase / FMN adenylyltransferase
MRIVRHFRALTPDLQKAAVAIGNFDGMHLGHRAVLNLMKARAKALNVPSAVITFEPHPRTFFDKENAPKRLMRVRDKYQAMKDLGIDIVYVLRFDGALAGLPAEQFIHQLLVTQLAVKDITTGDNFVFGKGRLGTVGLIKAGAEFSGHYTANAVPAVMVGGAPVSSSRVRGLLKEGKVEECASLFGVPYRQSGRVVHGDARARTLGYPTANIIPPTYLALPSYGVYLVWVKRQASDVPQAAIANIGVKPTFGAVSRPVLEVHVLDQQLALYGETLEVEFIRRVRAEQPFPNLAALAAQIARDVVSARQYFASLNEPSA